MIERAENKVKAKVFKVLVGGVLMAICGRAIIAAETRQAEGKPICYAIRDVRVFDGKNVIEKTTVLVRDGKIEKVAAAMKIPDDARVIDGKGKTLLPGLIDAHVHVLTADNLWQPLIFGVTALVDMFSPVAVIQEIKKEQASGLSLPQQAFIVSPMTVATAPGGHCTEYGVPIPTLELPGQASDFVAARIAEGSDFIKIIYDDGSAYNFSLPTLKRETLAAVIHEARAQGKVSVVHAGNLKKCREALEAGADGLAHLNFDDAFDPDFGKLAAEKKAFVIPTLWALESMNGHADAVNLVADKYLAPWLKPADIQALRLNAPIRTSADACRAAEKVVRQLRESGVAILAGSDTPNMGKAFGVALHGELELLVRAGLTPLEALRAATSLPAMKFGMRGRGFIRVGAVADLVLVEGDPIADIKATRAIVTVWKDGVPVNREEYRGAVRKEEEASAKELSAPPPENFGSGLISDFEAGQIKANFGIGWAVSTDSYLGGKSKAEMTMSDDGANGSTHALLVQGTVAEAGTIRYAGVLFSPGVTFMAPANLSGKKVLSFWAKGEGRTFAVMIFARSLGFIPQIKNVKIEKEWQEFRLPLADFNSDGHDIMGIFIGAAGDAGDFSLKIDNIQLQ